MVIGCVDVPVVIPKVSDDGLAARTAPDPSVNVTLTVCELPAITTPSLTADSEIDPLYRPALSDAEVGFTVKVILPPDLTTAEGGETCSQS
jgi:hypothetical protein